METYELKDSIFAKIKARLITKEDVKAANKFAATLKFQTSWKRRVFENTEFDCLIPFMIEASDNTSENRFLKSHIGNTMFCEVDMAKKIKRCFILPLNVFNEYFVCVSKQEQTFELKQTENLLQGDYEKEINQFKIYPKEKEAEYLVLGLVGESGEVANIMKKVIRNNNGIMTPEQSEQIKDELGDVLWYLSAFANACGYSLNDIANHNLEKLKERALNNNLKHQ